MAEREAKIKSRAEIEESLKPFGKGIELLAVIGENLVIVNADITLLREQDKNAHLMKPEMFRQLSENIKKRNGLESLPFCALTDLGIEIISGHHRCRASKDAGLKAIPVILDVSGLNRSQIAAKQIAHNALVGFDDKSTLKEIARLIQDVDDMIESFIGKDILGEPEGTLEKLISPILNYDWQEIQFVFLPHQVKDLDSLVKNAGTGVDYIGAAPLQQFEKLLETLASYQKFSDIKNIGAAIHRIIETALQQMQDAGFEQNEEWVPLSRILGNAAIPAEAAEKIKSALHKLEKEERIPAGRKWEGLVYLIDNCMA